MKHLPLIATVAISIASLAVACDDSDPSQGGGGSGLTATGGSAGAGTGGCAGGGGGGCGSVTSSGTGGSASGTGGSGGSTQACTDPPDAHIEAAISGASTANIELTLPDGVSGTEGSINGVHASPQSMLQLITVKPAQWSLTLISEEVPSVAQGSYATNTAGGSASSYVDMTSGTDYESISGSLIIQSVTECPGIPTAYFVDGTFSFTGEANDSSTVDVDGSFSGIKVLGT